jgi:ubiquinone/menaquinone biosynthesis C-methylase UbiE
MEKENIKKEVRKRYAKVARSNGSRSASNISCCSAPSDEQVSTLNGYSQEELNAVPEDANLGLGCGNPTALASLKEGETVLDLGSGAGFDCFLASKKVGKSGKVIGVDMTPEMLDKARSNTKKGKYTNVEFRLGEIENLPVADDSVDVIISNCVINLSTNKKRVFEESYRVLSPKGRLMVSDIVLLKKLPEVIQKDLEAYAGCIAGAEIKEKYLELMRKAGFKEIKVLQEKVYPIDYVISEPELKEGINRLGLTKEQFADLAKSVVSISVSASKL